MDCLGFGPQMQRKHLVQLKGKLPAIDFIILVFLSCTLSLMMPFFSSLCLSFPCETHSFEKKSFPSPLLSSKTDPMLSVFFSVYAGKGLVNAQYFRLMLLRFTLCWLTRGFKQELRRFSESQLFWSGVKASDLFVKCKYDLVSHETIVNAAEINIYIHICTK